MASRSRLRRILSGIVVLAAVPLAACSATLESESFTIGLVTNNGNGLRNVEGFVTGMADLGYVEGDNVSYVFAGGPLQGDDLTGELERMVDARVDLIFTAGTPTGVAAFEITQGSEIPVVFGVIADPIKAGVMSDLTNPGGNMTGVKLGGDQSRRLELLIEVAAGADRIFVPFNPDDAAAAGGVDQISAVAVDLGVELVLGPARSDDEVTALLADFPPDVDAVFLVPDSVVNARLAEIIEVATAARLPTSGPSIAQVEGGALMSYGFVHRDAGAQAARFADQILRGADPGTLPVENTESLLAINLVAADAIGLAISDELLQQANIVLRGSDDE